MCREVAALNNEVGGAVGLVTRDLVSGSEAGLPGLERSPGHGSNPA